MRRIVSLTASSIVTFSAKASITTETSIAERRDIMRLVVSSIVALAAVLLALTSTATADVPNLMHYQRHLTDEEGRPLDTAAT